jgi:hypothetical protein
MNEAINEVKELINNSEWEVDVKECDERDGFVYVVICKKTVN